MSKEVAAAKAEEDWAKEPAFEEQNPTPELKREIREAPVKYKVSFRYGLNLRKTPGKQSPILKVLPNGAEVLSDGPVAEADGTQWLPVEDGWVDAAYLTLAGAEG